MKKLLLILGNGFSIDFINNICKEDEIDVKNLFRFGHTVKFPDFNIPGFLSYRHCPSLWLLGARANKDGKESMSIIEEIITCSNMLFEYLGVNGADNQRLKLIQPENQSLYIKAYSELIAYLKHLFIEYNYKITDEELKELSNSEIWGWIEFFKGIIKNKKYDEINVITYNYDIWLERILNILGIEYNINGFEEKNCQVKITKPHGSISFVPKSGKSTLYSVNYNIDSTGTDINQISVCNKDLEQYDKNYLIPPAGDSSRRRSDAWATRLREHALESAKGLNANDDVIICGMSYWHVDRKELDELLIHLDQGVNLTLINPHPPKELNAVLVSLFKNYTVYASSETLKEVVI